MTRTKNKHGEGSVEEYRPGAWRARYTTKEGERLSKAGFASEKAARAYLRQALTNIDRGEFFDDSKGDILFSDFAAEVLQQESTSLSAGTVRNWQSLFRTTLFRHSERSA
jgi:hypothetical protein